MPERPRPPSPANNSAGDVICIILACVTGALAIAAFSFSELKERVSTQNSTCKEGYVMIKDAFGKMACVRGYNVGEDH